MRDRQPMGSIVQREVIDSTCSAAQAATASVLLNNITPDPIGIISPTYFSPLSSGVNSIPQSSPFGERKSNIPLPNGFIDRAVVAGPSISSSVLGYRPCAPSNEWFVSQSTIRCSGAFAATGFAPDPKDCSKYYACDGIAGPDGMSSGETRWTHGSKAYISL